MKPRKIILSAACLVLLVIAVVQTVAKHIDPVKVITIKEEIDEVKIDRPEGTLILKKTGDSWTVGEQKYPGNDNACEAVAETFKSIRLLDKITKTDKEAVLAKYDLNKESECEVSVYHEGKLLRTFHVGKSTSTNSQVYMRLDDNDEVYMAAGTIRSDCTKTENELRSKAVIQVSRDDISSVTVIPEGGKEWQLSRSVDGSQWSVSGEGTEGIEVDMEKAVNWFQACASLAASDWLSSEAGITGELIQTVRIALPSRTITLELFQGQDSDGDDVYSGKCSETPYCFKLTKYSVQKYQKSPEDFE